MAKGKYQEWITPDGLLQIEGWARDGLTDEQIAKNIGISAKTLYEWENRFSKIRETIKKGKGPVDLEVENALLKRAIGFEYTETVKEVRQLPGGKTYTTIREFKKYALPDTTAQAIWLNNRKPKRWQRDRRVTEVEISESNDGFLEALNGTAAEDWAEDGDEETSGL